MRTPTSFSMNFETLEKLKVMADASKQKRSQFIRDLIDAAWKKFVEVKK